MTAGAFSCQLPPNHYGGGRRSLAPSPGRGRGGDGTRGPRRSCRRSHALPACRAVGHGVPGSRHRAAAIPAKRAAPASAGSERAGCSCPESPWRRDWGDSGSRLMPSPLRVLSWLRTDSRFGGKELLRCSKRLPRKGRQRIDPSRQIHGTQTAGILTPKAPRCFLVTAQGDL